MADVSVSGSLTVPTAAQKWDVAKQFRLLLEEIDKRGGTPLDVESLPAILTAVREGRVLVVPPKSPQTDEAWHSDLNKVHISCLGLGTRTNRQLEAYGIPTIGYLIKHSVGGLKAKDIQGDLDPIRIDAIRRSLAVYGLELAATNSELTLHDAIRHCCETRGMRGDERENFLRFFLADGVLTLGELNERMIYYVSEPLHFGRVLLRSFQMLDD